MPDQNIDPNFFIKDVTKSDILRDFARAAGLKIVDVPLAEIKEDGVLFFQGSPIPEPKSMGNS